MQPASGRGLFQKHTLVKGIPGQARRCLNFSCQTLLPLLEGFVTEYPAMCRLGCPWLYLLLPSLHSGLWVGRPQGQYLDGCQCMNY
jgi:hypothetical protein